jgi:hypothetical protein
MRRYRQWRQLTPEHRQRIRERIRKWRHP